MARPRWCLYVEVQNTGDDVTAAPLPKTIGIVDPIGRGLMPVRVARTHLPYYGREQNSDVTGFFRLDSDNINSPATKTACVNVPPGTDWVETNPISFITDAGEVTGVKSDDTLTVRVRARWDKADTTQDPQLKQMRAELVERWEIPPNPPTFIVHDTFTVSITNTFALYTGQASVSTNWASYARYLLRFVGRFKPQPDTPPL